MTQASFTSPFAAAFALPIERSANRQPDRSPPNWAFFGAFVAFYLLCSMALLLAMMGWLFNIPLADGH